MTHNRPSDAVDIRHGDALDVLRGLPDESVEAFITDPPYGLSQEPDMAEVLTHWLAGDDYKHRGGGFMGKAWDSFVPGPAVWREAYRVLKPGGHLLCFAGTRTSDLMGISIRLAGFEIRDRIRCETTGVVLPAELGWIYGSGFPKNLDVGKAIDRQRKDNVDWQRVGAWLRDRRVEAGISAKALCAAIGAHGAVNHGGAVANWEGGLSCPTWDQWAAMREALGFGDEMDAEVWRLNGRKGTPGEVWGQREVIGTKKAIPGVAFTTTGPTELIVTAPATEDAARWDGWGTALKPSYEPIIVARKPLISTVAQNVLTYGTGALNIDATRVGGDIRINPPAANGNAGTVALGGGWNDDATGTTAAGRWPSNVVLVHGEGCVPVGTRKVRTGIAVNRNRSEDNATSWYGTRKSQTGEDVTYADGDGTETVEAWECVEGCPVAEMDAQSGEASYNPAGAFGVNHRDDNNNGIYGGGKGITQAGREVFGYGDRGGASRFFPTFRYQAKADGGERPSYIGPVCFADAGCSQVTDEMHPSVWPEWARDPKGVCPECGTPCGPIMHPTVKPTELARWLIRLVLAKGGTFIDPYVGSGTFAEAAILEGVNAIVVDKVGAHIPLIEQRVKKYDNPHAMAAVQRGEKVATRAKPRKVAVDDEDDLFAGWAS